MRAALICSLAFALSAPVYAATCAGLASMTLADTEITTAEAVGAGPFRTTYGTTGATPGFCRVSGVIRPTTDSVIRFEVWLPAKVASAGTMGWNQRLLDVGNGGFAGSIYYDQMANNLRLGYATAGTDAGHQAEAEDASWAYKHPEKVKDFGYRAVHLMTERAKAIVAEYYGVPPKKAYFDACSDGGREALMEAQRFPEDYDGILAGAPANDWTGLLTAGLDVGRALLADPAAYISGLKLPAIKEAVLRACDAQDGAKDGILNDPRACRFKPETLLCKAGDELGCLTAPQIGALKKLYRGSQGASGEVIFPGLMPGDEESWRGWTIGGSPGESHYVENFFRYMVYDDPEWTGKGISVDAAHQAANEKTGAAVNSTDPDLTSFIARGGKLMIYHGWNDPAISPLNSIHYYESVKARVGVAKAENSVRLYMVPGMEHCSGGPGPAAFGQLGLPTAKGEGALEQLEGWVEAGKEPEMIYATQYGASRKVLVTRPLCPYPRVGRYDGKGDPNAGESFTCVSDRASE